jgi:quercetin dioxygenase-like cupin family protein
MNTAKLIIFGMFIFVTGVLVGKLDIADAKAQETPPAESKGIGITKLGVVPKESVSRQTGLEGYVLQLRLATIEPGGQIARHDHSSRPGLVYTLEGSIVEGRPEGERQFPAGEQVALVEDADTDHWAYNRTDKTATILICDLDNRG